MSRSIKKGPFIDEKLYKRIKKANEENINTPIQTYSRASTIIPDMIGKTIAVHNGRRFIPVKINENIVGHKLGEFSPTRLFRGHGGDKKIR
jgi:small subunit ribosomal protein S19